MNEVLNLSELPSRNANGIARLEALKSVSVETQATSIVGYSSAGQLLIIGSQAQVNQVHKLVADNSVNPLFLLVEEPKTDQTSKGDSNPPNCYIASLVIVTGYLGAFTVMVSKNDRTFNLAETAGLASGVFDLILNLSDYDPIGAEIQPPGYIWIEPATQNEENVQQALEQLSELVGNFEKPKYYNYDSDICAHGASGITACTRCIDACPTNAITSIGEIIEVDSHLCQGGGSCATACPTGAITYSYPPSNVVLETIRQLLKKYSEAGGTEALILFHDRENGRSVVSSCIDHLDESIIPIEVEEVGSIGLEIYLSVLAYGASGAKILCSEGVAPSVRRELNDQISLLSAFLGAMGYAEDAISIVDADELNSHSRTIHLSPHHIDIEPARFAPTGIKRTDLRTALDHLHAAASVKPDQVALPSHAPFGEIRVDTSTCTLCMGCVSVCPASALEAGGDVPKLSFIENNCVQCGLCQSACPESSITLHARYLFDTDTRMRSRTMNEDAPFHCRMCGKPFATNAMLNRMKDKLKGHHMFQGVDAMARLEMCEDCRVKDMFASEGGFPRDRL